jgi:hypothetical protein
MKINLTQKEIQAILCAVHNQLDDLNELKTQNKLSVGWKIMFDDFNKGIEKLKKQYLEQIAEIVGKK